MTPSPRPTAGDSPDPMPADLRDLLAGLQRASGASDPTSLLDLTRRLRTAAHRDLPAHSPLRRSIDSEDLVQEAVVDLVRAAPTFRGRTWGEFFRFALALLDRRKVGHARRAMVRRAERDAAVLDLESVLAPVRSPSAAVGAGDDTAKARGLLRELASPYRETLELKLAGHSTAEIASRLGASETTIRQRIARALRMLKARW